MYWQINYEEIDDNVEIHVYYKPGKMPTLYQSTRKAIKRKPGNYIPVSLTCIVCLVQGNE